MACILVVDDRPTNREFLVTLLGYRKHRMLEAGDGAEALAMVRAHHPDLVITDILMPTMDGYEFVRQLRADPLIAATTVIFYTAHYHKHEADAIAASCGVRRILTKPCEPDIILRVVEESLTAPAQVPEPVPVQEFDRQHLRIITDKLAETVDDLRMTNQRIAALVDINLQLASERDPRQLLKNVCVNARELFAARHALLAVGHRDTGDNAFGFSSGMDEATAAKLTSPALREGRIGAAFVERKSFRMDGLEGDPQAVGLPMDHPPVHSLVVAPIASLAHVYGWLCLTDKVGASGFSAEDERLLGILAAQVGRIYENGSLYREIQQHAVELESEIEQRRKIEEALSDSELRFRQMAENMRDAFFLEDLISHRILYINPAYQEIWGRSAESLYANPQSWIDAIHPDDRAAIQEKYLRATTTGKMEFEYRIVRPDGAIRWIETRGFPVRDAAGNVIRVTGVAKDVTGSRQAAQALRESERRFNDMLGNVELISVMLDRQARIVFCNDYLLRLTGWRREEVFGRDWFEVFIPPELGVKDVFAALIENQPSARHHENDILTRTGERRLIRWNNSVLRSGAGEVTGVASIGEDITERRLAEDVLRKRNEELEKFHRMSVGRELQMIELKKQVNAIAAKAGEKPPYDLSFVRKGLSRPRKDD